METLHTIGTLFMDLLPVAGTILLVYLIFFVRHLTQTLKGVDQTIFDIDGQINKLDAPLNSIIELSHTVDEVHHNTKEAIRKTSKEYQAKREVFEQKIAEFKMHVKENEKFQVLEKEALKLLDSQQNSENQEMIQNAKHKIIEIYACANDKMKESKVPEKAKEIVKKASQQAVVVLNATKDKLYQVKNDKK